MRLVLNAFLRLQTINVFVKIFMLFLNLLLRYLQFLCVSYGTIVALDGSIKANQQNSDNAYKNSQLLMRTQNSANPLRPVSDLFFLARLVTILTGVTLCVARRARRRPLTHSCALTCPNTLTRGCGLA